jgi:deoxyribonuclease-4
LDTAHLFAAGYDISTEAGLEKTIARMEERIGLENVFVFHVNDSKISLGGRVDRHAHIGEGKIKSDAFERILKHPRLSADPATGLPGRVFLLETPIEDPGDDRRNVAKLWELSGVEGPAAEKGYSMLTAALKKKLLAQKKVQRKIATAAARKSGAKGIRNAKKG